jgi:hypothetical protein
MQRPMAQFRQRQDHPGTGRTIPGRLNVIEDIWGSDWIRCSKLRKGLLRQRMEEAVDGDIRVPLSPAAAFETFFGKHPELWLWSIISATISFSRSCWGTTA